MADLAVTNEFVDATAAEATEVNTNFTDIVDWVNTNAIRKDGTVAFTGAPSYAADPASANQLARKSYIDQYAIPTVVSSVAVDLQTQPAANNQVLFGGGAAIPAFTLSWNATLWGVGQIQMDPSVDNNPLNVWECQVLVNDVIKGVFRIPLVGAGQSMAVILPHVNVNSGSGNTVKIFTENVSSTGYTAEFTSASTTRSWFELSYLRR